MNDDAELLRKYATSHDEIAFGTVVQRRIGFVYAVCLRRLRDSHAAQDSTQAVFIALARKAGRVADTGNVLGWLHRSACYEAINVMRATVNRLNRETEAQRRTDLENALGSETEAKLGTLIDEALDTLGEADRAIVLARYFDHQSYAVIGGRLNLTENAARMRVDRALDRLREQLHRRGFTSSAALIAAALPACATAAVPAPLAATVTKAACVAGAASTGISFVTAMNSFKVIATCVALTAAGGFMYEHRRTSQLETALAAEHKTHTRDAARIQSLIEHVAALETAADIAATQISQPTPRASGTLASAAPEPNEQLPAGVTTKAPTGWHKNGSRPGAYTVGTDALNSWGGTPSAYVKSSGAADGDFGGMMQTISAEQFLNKRVRLTAWMKTEDAQRGANLWMRVDGQSQGQSLAFDNMNNRQPKGTTGWQQYSVVLDVPANATALNYGVFVAGEGKAWINGLSIDPVGPEVASTDMLPKKPQLPKSPTNLGFSSDGGQ
jgi:RNA polymerase sigma factor (sigma-70 family)